MNRVTIKMQNIETLTYFVDLTDMWCYTEYKLSHFDEICKKYEGVRLSRWDLSEEQIAHLNGFLYVSDLYRIVFLYPGFSDAEKKLIPAHEEGHYCLERSIIGRAVTEEYEAYESVHYLLEQRVPERISDF